MHEMMGNARWELSAHRLKVATPFLHYSRAQTVTSEAEFEPPPTITLDDGTLAMEPPDTG